ncbi:hypothetical protein PAXRUDRAFT_174081, partial [Paxillus rubicundulus Ve08.2h10]
CLIICLLTLSMIVPHIFQLQASIATLNQHDTIITAGTASGKTLSLNYYATLTMINVCHYLALGHDKIQ